MTVTAVMTAYSLSNLCGLSVAVAALLGSFARSSCPIRSTHLAVHGQDFAAEGTAHPLERVGRVLQAIAGMRLH